MKGNVNETDDADDSARDVEEDVVAAEWRCGGRVDERSSRRQQGRNAAVMSR